MTGTRQNRILQTGTSGSDAGTMVTVPTPPEPLANVLLVRLVASSAAPSRTNQLATSYAVHFPPQGASSCHAPRYPNSAYHAPPRPNSPIEHDLNNMSVEECITIVHRDLEQQLRETMGISLKSKSRTYQKSYLLVSIQLLFR